MAVAAVICEHERFHGGRAAARETANMQFILMSALGKPVLLRGSHPARRP
jgi:hypothetical protein